MVREGRKLVDHGCVSAFVDVAPSLDRHLEDVLNHVRISIWEDDRIELIGGDVSLSLTGLDQTLGSMAIFVFETRETRL